MSYEKAADLASRSSYGISFGSILAGFTLNEWAAIVGIAATVLTMLVNIWFKFKHYRLELAKALAEGVKLDE